MLRQLANVSPAFPGNAVLQDVSLTAWRTRTHLSHTMSLVRRSSNSRPRVATRLG